jgi:hypothetical protein
MRRINALKTSGKTKKINKYKLNCISHEENINVVLYVLYQQHTIKNILFFVKSKLNLHTDILKRSLGDEGRGGWRGGKNWYVKYVTAQKKYFVKSKFNLHTDIL